MGKLQENHRKREATATFLEQNFLHQAERHFDHINDGSHDMRDLLLFANHPDCKAHRQKIMRAMNKMHDELEFIRRIEADHPEFHDHLGERGNAFMKAHNDAVMACQTLRKLHTDLHKDHHESTLP